MKLSEIPAYKKYMFDLVEKKYDQAEQALKLCIEAAKREDDKETLIFLIQNMGNLYFQKGERDKALEYYIEAEKIDGGSPLAKYHFAKFLSDKLKHYDQAINKCNEIITIASSHPWPETEYDSSSKHYLALCYALQGYCYCLLGNFEKAGANLLQLLALKEEYVIDYAVKFCDQLISNGYFVIEAKQYLADLLARLAESNKLQTYDEFASEMKKILSK